MTKEKAMKLLRLKDGFTYKELENAYQKFKKYYSDEYKYKAHYFLDTPIQLIEIEEAYNFLKNGHFYVIPDLLFKYSRNYSNDSKDIHELSFKKSKRGGKHETFTETARFEQGRDHRHSEPGRPTEIRDEARHRASDPQGEGAGHDLREIVHAHARLV